MWQISSSFCPRATTVILLFLAIFQSAHSSEDRRRRKSTKEVVWSASTPLFGNTSSDGPAKPASITVHAGNSVEFLCPKNSEERLVISAVSEMSLIECQLDSTSAPFLICYDKNRRGKKLLFQNGNSAERTTNIDQGSANTELDPVYYRQPGTVQYFISTSNGTSADGLWNSRGGLCASANLRLRMEFSDNDDDGDTSSTVADGSVASEAAAALLPLEYSIEEMPAAANIVEQQSPATEGQEQRQEASGDNGDQVVIAEQQDGGGGDPRYRLAKSLSIKPEYLEFVRNHAINGGTGDIRFPPTEEDARDQHVKWPRFVSRNSNSPWRRARPPPLLVPPVLPRVSSSQGNSESGEVGERHTKEQWQRPKSSSQPVDSATPPFSRDQLIWSTNSASLTRATLNLFPWIFLAIFFAILSH